jgi:hypothetical protein
MRQKKLRIITDEEVEKFAKRLIALGKAEEETPENESDAVEPLYLSAENLVIFLKKKGK